jgi:ankyrin repeat protein
LLIHVFVFRLFEFALHGKTSELKQLLSSGEVPSIKVLDSRGRTALNIAVTEEHLEVVEVRGRKR